MKPKTKENLTIIGLILLMLLGCFADNLFN
jgi:hypothetical protein